MENQIVLPPIVPLFYNGQAVLTSKEITAVYGCKAGRIKDNFYRHKSEFIEGVDYFKLVGKELEEIKDQLKASRFSTTTSEASRFSTTRTTNLVVWTQSGALKHAQFLNTPYAKMVFSKLSQAYFFTATAPPVNNSNPPLALPESEPASVYAFAMSNNTVKIGMSGNISDRLKSIERETLLKVNGVFSLEVDSRQKAFEIEKTLHEYFSAQCTQGEFFNIAFNEVCNRIKILVAESVTADEFSSREKIELLLKIAELTENKNLREEIILEAFKYLK